MTASAKMLSTDFDDVESSGASAVVTEEHKGTDPSQQDPIRKEPVVAQPNQITEEPLIEKDSTALLLSTDIDDDIRAQAQ